LVLTAISGMTWGRNPPHRAQVGCCVLSRRRCPFHTVRTLTAARFPPPISGTPRRAPRVGEHSGKRGEGPGGPPRQPAGSPSSERPASRLGRGEASFLLVSQCSRAGLAPHPLIRHGRRVGEGLRRRTGRVLATRRQNPGTTVIRRQNC
jgi:hypothetical protein